MDTTNPQSQTPQPPSKVLIVDDDKFLLNMYSIKFKKSGLDMVSATNGMEALNKLRAGLAPDAVVLDIVMPGMDGFEMLEKARAEGFLKNARIIFLTNQGQQPDIDRAKAFGAVGYIVKASTIPSEVVDKVFDILKNK